VLDGSCGHWNEEQANVAVDAGVFSSVVGSVNSLTEDDLDEDNLFISVAVADDDGAFYLLGAPQKVHTTPQAAVVAEMSTYTVQTLDVTGALSADTADIAGRLDADDIVVVDDVTVGDELNVGGHLDLDDINGSARVRTTSNGGFTFFADSDNNGADTNTAFRVSTNDDNFGNTRRDLMFVFQDGSAELRGDFEADSITIPDLTATDTDSGCVVFSGVQMCWQEVVSSTAASWSTHTFDKPFGNNDYSIACTPSMNSGDDLQRYMTVRDKTTANYEVQTWSTGGGRSGVGGSCIAFGVPGGSW